MRCFGFNHYFIHTIPADKEQPILGDIERCWAKRAVIHNQRDVSIQYSRVWKPPDHISLVISLQLVPSRHYRNMDGNETVATHHRMLLATQKEDHNVPSWTAP